MKKLVCLVVAVFALSGCFGRSSTFTPAKGAPTLAARGEPPKRVDEAPPGLVLLGQTYVELHEFDQQKDCIDRLLAESATHGGTAVVVKAATKRDHLALGTPDGPTCTGDVYGPGPGAPASSSPAPAASIDPAPATNPAETAPN